MTNLDVQVVTTYEAFVDAWPGDDFDSRLLWQLLGQLDADEVLVQLPEWFAEEKAGFVEGAPPTAVIGRIERETDRAILLADSAAPPLMKLAHRIHELEETEGDQDRDEWLNDRLAEHRQSFENRNGVPALADEWLPESQLQAVVRRREWYFRDGQWGIVYEDTQMRAVAADERRRRAVPMGREVKVRPATGDGRPGGRHASGRCTRFGK